MSEAEQDAVIGRIVRDLAVNKRKLEIMTVQLERYEKAFNALGNSLSRNAAADFNLKAASQVINTSHEVLQGFEVATLISFLEEYTQVREAVESGAASLRQLSGGRTEEPQMQINALFEPDTEKGGFVVTFPDFPWGVTQGDTEEEATEMAVDAITLVIDELIKRGEEIPRQSKVRGRKYHVLDLPALAAAKVELYRVARGKGRILPASDPLSGPRR